MSLRLSRVDGNSTSIVLTDGRISYASGYVTVKNSAQAALLRGLVH